MRPCVPAGFVSGAQQAEVLDAARTALAQGRLSDAEELLTTLPAMAGPGDRAAASLLLGNVRYERGAFDAAAACYDEAARQFALAADPARAEAGTRVATENLALARDSLARRRLRAAEAGQLELATTGVVLAALATVAWLGWRARGASGPQRMSSSSSIAGTRAR